MAHELIARKLDALGGQARLRLKDGKPFITDNGNVILAYLRHWQIARPEELERIINNMAGVVTVGLFAQRGANVCLLGSPDGVKDIGV